jgi:glycosyltransferase involved in cell wall biosynthesis
LIDKADIDGSIALPSAPHGFEGWPWDDDRSVIAPPGLPKISVITPSYNQGRFLEQTIRSVLLQHYPNLEYIVIDGGSKDSSLEVIEKYKSHLHYWVSEPDRGQGHAINKGLNIATGQILCWLNSDDFFLPGTLATVGSTLADGTGNYALVGHCLRVDADGRSLKLEGKYKNRRRLLEFWKGYHMHQPAMFWRREVFEKTGFVNEELHLILDFDYWARITEGFDFITVDRILACCNYHESAKTGDGYGQYHADLKKHATRYWGSKLSPAFWQLKLSMIMHLTLRPKLSMIKHLTLRLKISPQP